MTHIVCTHSCYCHEPYSSHLCQVQFLRLKVAKCFTVVAQNVSSIILKQVPFSRACHLLCIISVKVVSLVTYSTKYQTRSPVVGPGKKCKRFIFQTMLFLRLSKIISHTITILTDWPLWAAGEFFISQEQCAIPTYQETAIKVLTYSTSTFWSLILGSVFTFHDSHYYTCCVDLQPQ